MYVAMTITETSPDVRSRARAWLDQAEPDTRVERHGGDFHAIAYVAHPAAADIRTRVLGIGTSRELALEALDAELLELAVWAFGRPARAAQAAARAREAHVYRPGIIGTARIAHALEARGEAPLRAGEAHLAALARGEGQHLVGEIADEVVAARRVARYARPLSDDQRALL